MNISIQQVREIYRKCITNPKMLQKADVLLEEGF